MAYSDDYQGQDRARRRYEKSRQNKETYAERVARGHANPDQSPAPDTDVELDSRTAIKRHNDPERRHRDAVAAVAAVRPIFEQFAGTFHCELLVEPDRLTLIGPEGCFLAASSARDIIRFDMVARGRTFVTLLGERPKGNDYRAVVMEWARQAKIKPAPPAQ